MEILGLFFVLGAAAFLGSLGFFMASIFTRDPRVLGLELTGAMMCFIGIAAISGLTLMLVSASGAGIWLMTVGPSVVSLAISILIGRRAAAADVQSRPA